MPSRKAAHCSLTFAIHRENANTIEWQQGPMFQNDNWLSYCKPVKSQWPTSSSLRRWIRGVKWKLATSTENGGAQSYTENQTLVITGSSSKWYVATYRRRANLAYSWPFCHWSYLVDVPKWILELLLCRLENRCLWRRDELFTSGSHCWPLEQSLKLLHKCSSPNRDKTARPVFVVQPNLTQASAATKRCPHTLVDRKPLCGPFSWRPSGHFFYRNSHTGSQRRGCRGCRLLQTAPQAIAPSKSDPAFENFDATF